MAPSHSHKSLEHDEGMVPSCTGDGWNEKLTVLLQVWEDQFLIWNCFSFFLRSEHLNHHQWHNLCSAPSFFCLYDHLIIWSFMPAVLSLHLLWRKQLPLVFSWARMLGLCVSVWSILKAIFLTHWGGSITFDKSRADASGLACLLPFFFLSCMSFFPAGCGIATKKGNRSEKKDVEGMCFSKRKAEELLIFLNE